MKTLLTALLFVSSMAFAGDRAPASAAPSPRGTSGGRYQLVQISEYRRDQYLLDTQTGRLWGKVCGKNDEKGECAFYYWSEEITVGLSMPVKAFYKTFFPESEKDSTQSSTKSEAGRSISSEPGKAEQRGCCSHHGGVCGCSFGRAVCCDGNLSPSCGC